MVMVTSCELPNSDVIVLSFSTFLSMVKSVSSYSNSSFSNSSPISTKTLSSAWYFGNVVGGFALAASWFTNSSENRVR